MGTPLQVGALVARTLSLLHNIPLVGVNHCVGRMSSFPHLPLPSNMLTVAQTSRWAAKSPHPTTQSSSTSPAGTPK